MSFDPARLLALESQLGARLPPDFVASLTGQPPVREGAVALVTPDRTWDVRSTLGFDDGASCDQLDAVYGRVGSAVPPGTLPFAVDWGGNFYLLVLSGPAAGQVVWWDHEREIGDHAVEPVAASVADFYARLGPDPGA